MIIEISGRLRRDALNVATWTGEIVRGLNSYVCDVAMQIMQIMQVQRI